MSGRPTPRLYLPPPGSTFRGTADYLWSTRNSVLTYEQTTDLFEQVRLFRHHAWDAILHYRRVAPKILARFPSKDVTKEATYAATFVQRKAERRKLVEFFSAQDPHGKELALVVEDFQAFGRKEDRFGGLRPPRAAEQQYENTLQDLLEVWSHLNQVRTRLVEVNLRLAVSYAQRYECPGLDVSDLINQAAFGLYKAVDRFDLSRGYRFSTYAGWWVRHSVSRARVNIGRTIRLPSHLQMILYNIQKHWDECDGNLERIAEKVGKSPKQVAKAIEAAKFPLSLEQKQDDDGQSILDVLRDTGPEVEEAIYLDQLGPFLQEYLDRLKPQLRNVIEKRFGLNGYQPMTLRLIGEELSLSRERIRQLEKRGLEHLRDMVERE